MRVRVHLNDDPNAIHLGYNRKYAQLHHTFEFELKSLHPLTEMPHGVLERIRKQLGTDYATEPWAIEYRDKGFSPLSVGDVVVLDGSAYAVSHFGWLPVRLAPVNIIED